MLANLFAFLCFASAMGGAAFGLSLALKDDMYSKTFRVFVYPLFFCLLAVVITILCAGVIGLAYSVYVKIGG